MQEFSPEIKRTLEVTWNPEVAAANLERWLSVCRKEGWGTCPENLPLLVKVFGASWHFTRLVFYRGREITHYFDTPSTPDFSLDILYSNLAGSCAGVDLEGGLDRLRLRKNEIMLQIFLLQLENKLPRAGIELALTQLSESVLRVMLELLIRERRYQGAAPAVLAMGRMAGAEMNYGSDLDLIFLYGGEAGTDTSNMIRQIQALLRHIALPAPCGILYEIDMRLRPHGTSGTLISPARYFIDYHQEHREIWERQMMTRCRPVYDPDQLAGNALESIRNNIYSGYSRDHLRDEIVNMRARVEHELGRPRGKHEIKRGPGGIMDIDFLTHYLQLLHGREYPSLQTPSTRSALSGLEKLGFVTSVTSQELLQFYDYLKMIEGVLRVHDLKNMSAFSQQPESVPVLARAMGHLDNDQLQAGKDFLEHYNRTTLQVRSHFNQLVGEIKAA